MQGEPIEKCGACGGEGIVEGPSACAPCHGVGLRATDPSEEVRLALESFRWTMRAVHTAALKGHDPMLVEALERHAKLTGVCALRAGATDDQVADVAIDVAAETLENERRRMMGARPTEPAPALEAVAS